MRALAIVASLLIAGAAVAQPPHPNIVDRAHVDPSKGINFHALATPDTVYVGQQSTYQVGVFLDEVVRMRLRRNPEFLPPELRGLLAYDLPAGRASLRDRAIAGKRWDVHVFQRAVFPLEPGRTDIPGAQLTYSLPLSVGFFSREESYTARAERASIVAMNPPTSGRPAEWNGAVGVLSVVARVDTTTSRVGDSFIATLRVAGTANVKLLPRPPLSIPWASAVPSEERVFVDSTSLLVRGAKEFDWIVTPTAAGNRTFPAVRYAYFDPYARRYDVATTIEVPVLVVPGALATIAATREDTTPALAIRRVDRGPVSPPLPSRAAFWIIAALAPLPAATLVARRRPQRRAARRRALPPATRLRELTRDPAADVADVRRTFLGALGDRIASTGVSTSFGDARPRSLVRRLRRAGVTADAADAVERLTQRFDALAYSARDGTASPTSTSARELAVEANALFALVDVQARPREELAQRVRTRVVARVARPTVLALVCALPFGVPNAFAALQPASPFAAGVAAYEARDFAEAATLFDEAARAESLSPDAWANAGTAAWAVNDTLGAALGWQRALRLEPRAGELRTRLSLLPTSQDGSVAGVPPLPLDWAAAMGLGLWIVACAAITGRVARRGTDAPLLALASVAALGASVTAALCVQLGAVRAARDIAIVTVAGALRAEPILGADRTGVVERTDVAYVRSRRSVWTRVTLDGGRDGWIESERLTSLAPQ